MVKKTKWFVTAGTTLVVTATLAACGNNSSSTSSSKDINWALPTEILTLDNSKVTDHYSNMAIGNSGSNIYRTGKNGKLELDLAKKVDISDDGKTYTVTLRDNLKWSDGSKLTAKDFVYSWQRIVDPSTASEYAYLVSEAHVANAAEINSGQIADLSQLGVKAEGDNKLVFTLTSPAPQFKYFLSFTNFMPQKESVVKKYGKNYATASKYQVYSGPYTVTGWNGSNGTFKLKKNKYYWDAKHVKTDTVNVQTVKKPDTAVQMYKRGELDNANISNTSAIFNANKNNKDVVDVREATTCYMAYNMTGSVKGLDNKKIRQALNLATDRKAVVKAAIDTGSTAATALVPYKLETLSNGKDLTDVVAPGYKYDAKEAARLFKEGLAESGLTSLKLAITSDAETPTSKNLVDYIKSAWESALPGLTVEEKFVTFKQRLEDSKNQNFDVVVTLWGGDYPEGSTFYGLFQSTASYNNGKFNSSAYDAAYTKAITTDATNQEAGVQDYKEAEKILYEEAAYNPLYFRNTKALRNPKLTGLVENTTGLNTDFTHAYKK
ncbi:peptide ABC transporter substrate-binding protein [Streptococcus sciuri]|uniref:Peptide ABC transporter substrate-binding protein n=1 Tax=Streptococcus sciuri TaxID=2973939 RepID=A0ABT2F6P7_9STRE|nr:peptide ABC transporter substrate-binding protein [Streptococcus sciuri]MCS4488133.1 peptide ABC transporter substrate-binding protein [Streptococcus sciuri]